MAIVEYNGDTTIQAVKITTWKQDPILAPDGESIEGTKHVVTGEGIIDADTPTNFSAALLVFRKAWHEQGGVLVIDLGTDDVVLIDEGDQFQGPHVRYSLLELTHVSAIVSFEITYSLFETGGTLNDIASHTWTQRFVVDEAGLSRYFVTGKLRTLRHLDNAAQQSGNNGGWDGDLGRTNVGVNPDRYRHIVLPELPVGFRVARMEFAVDESQTRLIYSIEMFQAVRALPAPAQRGTASFRWHKSLNTGNGMLGKKVVEIELEAGKNVSPAALLKAAYEVSQTMITYTGSGSDLVTDVEVEQPDLFEKNVVTLRVAAMGNVKAPADSDGPLVPLNVDLVKLGETIEGMDPYVPPGAYAQKGDLKADVAQVIYRIQEQARWVPDSAAATFPRGSLEEITTDVVEQTYVIPRALYEDLDVDASNQQGSSGQTGEQIAFAHTNVEVREWVEVVDSGMRVLRPRALNSTDIPFQIDKPTVLVHSEATLIRRGKHPERAMLKMPPGAVLRSEEFKVRPGPIDAGGWRTYIAMHTRVVELADAGGNSNIVGFGNQAHDVGVSPLGGGEQYTFRTWWPPANVLAFPHDPTIEDPASARGRHLFQGSGSEREDDFFVHAELPNHYFEGGF